jgi:hypothetical protein
MSDLYSIKDLLTNVNLIDCFTKIMFDEGEFYPWLEQVISRLARTKGLSIDDYIRQKEGIGPDLRMEYLQFIYILFMLEYAKVQTAVRPVNRTGIRTILIQRIF